MIRLFGSVCVLGGVLLCMPAGAQSHSDLAPVVTIVAIDSLRVSGTNALIIRTANPDSGDIVVIRSSALAATIINSALDELQFLRQKQGNVAAEAGLYRVTLRPAPSAAQRDPGVASKREQDRATRARMILFMLREPGGKRKLVRGIGEGSAMEYRYRLKSDSADNPNANF